MSGHQLKLFGSLAFVIAELYLVYMGFQFGVGDGSAVGHTTTGTPMDLVFYERTQQCSFLDRIDLIFPDPCSLT